MGLSCFKSWKYDRTGQKGSNRDVLASPGSYFFLSNSCGQGEDWLDSLGKGWIPFTGVFGQRLEETVLYERRYGVRVVPLVVEQCVAFIRERGLQEVGLFRQPGQATLVRELQEAFDAGEKPSFDSSTDVHTVASLLKLYLRQLPEPLVPYGRYQDFLLCGHQLANQRTQGLVQLRSLLHDLPVANFNLLQYICQFLNEVQSYSGYNKMSCQNLATVFGPNILRAKAEDPHSIIGGAAVVQQLMLELIREQQSLFSRPPPPPPATPASCSTHQGGGASLQPRPSVCSRQLSLPLITERLGGGGASSTSPAAPQRSTGTDHQHDPSGVPWDGAADSTPSQQRLRGHRYTSSHPENCFSPLPSTSYLPPQNHHHHHHTSTTTKLDPSTSYQQHTTTTTTTKLDYQHHVTSSSHPAFPAVPSSAAAGPATSSGLQQSRDEDPAAAPVPPDGSTRPRASLLLRGGWPEASRPGGEGEEEGAGFWASAARRRGAAAALDGVTRGTASGGSSSDALDDSTLSVYDNLEVGGASLGDRMDEVGGGGRYLESSAAATAEGRDPGGRTPPAAAASTEEAGQTIDSASSWSSCEIIPMDDEEGGGGESPASFPSNRGSEEDDDDDDEEDDMFHPNTPESSSAPTDERLSTGSSEVFLPSGTTSELQDQSSELHDQNSELQDQNSELQEELRQPRMEEEEEGEEGEVEDMRSLVAELRQQMAKQEQDYQARIHRLERCNDALQGQVRVLRASLEQQKRWHSVAEIKIRNVERARADADRRNATLQREMEHFFRMFGEISGGGGGGGGGGAEGRKGERFVQSF